MALTGRPRPGWAVAALSASLVGFWLALGGLRHSSQLGFREFLENDYPNIVFGLAFPVVGALMLTRAPRHWLGRLYCLSGLACALTLASSAYAQRGLVQQPGALPGALAAGWVSSWVWMCGFSPLITLGMLCFPDGRLPSRRWRTVAVFAALTILVGVVVMALRPGPLENQPASPNPMGWAVVGPWGQVLLGWWLPALCIAVIACFASLLIRYRSAPRAGRDQLRWFVVAGGLILTSFAIPASSPVGFVGNLLVVLALPLLPFSVGVALLRSQLVGVAVPVRRSLVYGWLAAAGLAVYAAVIVAFDALLRGRAQPEVALLGAGAVAVTYQPLRLRLQRCANRMLYGDRDDPYAVSTTLGRKLEAAGSAQQALWATVTAIAEALRLPYVAITLPGDPARQPSVRTGLAPVGEVLSLPLRYGGEGSGTCSWVVVTSSKP